MARGATPVRPASSVNSRWVSVRARLLPVVCLLLVSMLAGGMYAAYRSYRATTLWPLQSLRIDGQLRQLHSADVLQALALNSGTDLLHLDLTQMQAQLQALPWVKQAALRRVYPSQLIVEISEREPWLRLNEDALIDRDGRIFRPANLPAFEQLPLLQTTEAMLPLALIQYTVAEESLRPLGLALSSVRLSPRQALSIHLNNGVDLLFGREDWEDRLQRVIKLYPGLIAQGHVPMYIDVRYDTGFAVAWPPSLDAGTVRRTAGL